MRLVRIVMVLRSSCVLLRNALYRGRSADHRLSSTAWRRYTSGEIGGERQATTRDLPFTSARITNPHTSISASSASQPCDNGIDGSDGSLTAIDEPQATPTPTSKAISRPNMGKKEKHGHKSMLSATEISTMLKRGQIDDVLGLWEKTFGGGVDDRGVDDGLVTTLKPNIYLYNTILNYYARVRDSDKLTAWLQKMMDDGADINTTTYNILIRYYVKGNDHATVKSLVKDMREKGIMADSYTRLALYTKYSTAKTKAVYESLELYLAQNRIDEAVKIWEGAMARTHKADCLAFLPFLRYYAKLGDLRNALAWWNRMEAMGVTNIRNANYNCMLLAYVRGNDPSGAKAFVKAAKNRGFEPDSVTCNVVRGTPLAVSKEHIDEIRRLLKEGEEEAASENFKALAEGDYVVGLDPYLFASFLYHYARLYDMEKCIHWWELMRSHNVMPNESCFKARLKCHTLLGDIAGYRDALSIALSHGFCQHYPPTLDLVESTAITRDTPQLHQFDSDQLSHEIKKYLTENDEPAALKLWLEHHPPDSATEPEPSSVLGTMNEFLSFSVRGGNREGVEYWRREIFSLNVPPSPMTYCMLLQFYREHGPIEEANRIYKEGCDNGFQDFIETLPRYEDIQSAG